MQSLRGGDLADDIIEGAEAIAVYLCGDHKKRRRVYHLAETGQLPVFQLGSLLHARKSAHRAHIEQQERAALKSGRVA